MPVEDADVVTGLRGPVAALSEDLHVQIDQPTPALESVLVSDLDLAAQDVVLEDRSRVVAGSPGQERHMREAIDEGFRGTVYANGWPISLDPYLESIRNRPEFHAMANEINDAVAVMRERATQAELTGNWDELRALADSG